MDRDKEELFHLIFEPYILNILNNLKAGRKRFKDLKQLTKNDRTLSSKLKKLKELGLINTEPIEKDEKFFTGYNITDKGIKIIKALDKIQT